MKNEFTATEGVQESFVKAFQNLKSFKGKSKFSTWFYRIVINESIKTITRKGDKYTDIEPDSINHPHVEPLAIDQLKEEEQKYYINEALNKLPANESLVLRLFYLNENHIDEICEMTGWTNSKVKVLLHRARKKFEVILERKLKGEAETLI